MATLEELLSSKDPEQLKMLLGMGSSNNSDDSSSADNSNNVRSPASDSQITSPTPVAPEMLGLSMGPNSTQDPLAKVRSMNPGIAPSDASQASMSSSKEEEGDPSEVLSKVFSKNSSMGQSDSSTPGSNKGFTENTVAGLKAVQDEANSKKQLADMALTANLLQSGALGKKYHTAPPSTEAGDKLYQNQKLEADEKIKQFQDRGEKEKDDPGSASSVGIREFAKPMLSKLGINVPDNISYNQMIKISPMLEKMYEGRENREARADMYKDKAEDRALERERLTSTKKDASNVKRLDTLNHMITSQLATRSAFSKDALALNAVENAQALLEGGDLNKIDDRQIEEVARSLDRIISGGSPTISGTEHLSPQTARRKIARMLEYATNKRQGAGAADFLKTNQAMLEREKKIAQDRIRRTIKEAAGSYYDIAESNPEGWDNVMTAHNMQDALGSDKLAELKKLDSKKNSSDKSPSSDKSSNSASDAGDAANEEKRLTKDGRTAVFVNKKFVRYE